MDYIIQYSHRHGDFITFVMYKEAMRNTVLEHTLVFKRISEKFSKSKCVFISDIHRRVISNLLIEQVKEK